MSQTPDADLMVKFQFEADDDLWQDWKLTVPRDKSLEQRIIELLEADRDGRVVEIETADEDETDTRDREATPEPVDTDVREQLRPHVAGSGPLLERRLDALEAMHDKLRERGEATKDDLLPLADPDVVDYSDGESVWSNLVKGTLGEAEGVQAPPSGKSTWRWVGEK